MTVELLLAGLVLAIWLYLVMAHGGFWRASVRDDTDVPAPPAHWPGVVAVVPARNEAEIVARSVGSLLAQDYPGPFAVVLVDDDSTDGTAAEARAVAVTSTRRLTVLQGAPMPPGWTGKLWALSQGIAHAERSDFFPRRGKYLPQAGDGGETPVDDSPKALGSADDLDCSFAPSASLRSAPQRNRLRRFARPPGEENPLTIDLVAPKYVLLTDADIVHTPDNVRSLVARAEAGGLVLTSLMARLRCESFAERALIPAFIFFFQMLYPFAWVRSTDRRIAAAAGGCSLIRRESLAAAGGITAVRAAVIDDCALAARLKRQGPIWLGLTERAVSIRPYPTFGDIRRMVARSAYAQLDYSPLLLAGTMLGLVMTYLGPPLQALLARGAAAWAAAAAWALMSLAFLPTLRFYRRSLLWAPLMPVIAAAYTAFTLDSAVQYWRGRGGMWKGRAQAPAARGR
jgi:glycosyltransferase involved in cell wall biosynthesis